MEEMGKAKARAEEERAIYRLMLEQVHERALKERTDIRRDAQSKLEASAARMHRKKQQLVQVERQRAQLEEELAQAQKDKSQVNEEKNVYRQQCQDLMEQCQSLMAQLSLAHGGNQAVQLPAPRGTHAGRSPTAPVSPQPSNSLLDRMRSGVAKSLSAAQSAPSAASDRPDKP